MIKPEGDVSKLTKWAQRYIKDLERALKDEKKKTRDLSERHPGSNVAISGVMGDPDITLPPNSRVFFYVDEKRDRLTGTLEVKHDFNNPKRIRLSTYSMREIKIVPHSGNTFYIEIEER